MVLSEWLLSVFPGHDVSRPRALFLYSELSGYFLAPARLLATYYQVDVHIVRWPVHSDAPFDFSSVDWATVYERRAMSTADICKLARELEPDVAYVSGWADSAYCAAARQLRDRGVPVVCGLDTQWRGNLRQRVLTAAARPRLHRWFSHLWAAGLYQFEFARRLGFARENVLTGVYTADVEQFASVHHDALPTKTHAYPRSLLYVGRLAAAKGVRDLYSAFHSFRPKERAGWTLHFVGTGPLASEFRTGDDIVVSGFVQPHDLPALARDAGAFILPSHFEPWGVVLHEFAAAGLPLLASSACGAATAFVRPGYNGWAFASQSGDGLRAALERLFQCADEELLEMGRRSHQLSWQLTPHTWATTLLSVLDKP